MSKFFALMGRMKYIERWGLMRSTTKENIAEHSLEVAMLAHLLALIGNKEYGRGCNPESIALKAMYHEASEVLTGDMPAPIKYNNSKIRDAYKQIEAEAVDRLLTLLPEDFRADYADILNVEDEYECKIIKAADKLSALIKCIEELKSGNNEFGLARKSLTKEVDKLNLQEVKYFVDNFLSAYEMCIDSILNND